MDSETFARQIGQVIRERRQALGLTQKTLSLMTGVSRRYLVSLEMGESQGVRMNLLFRVLNALDITLDFSLKESGLTQDHPEKEQPSLLSEKNAENDMESYTHAFEYAVKNLGGRTDE